jgi:putative transposase
LNGGFNRPNFRFTACPYKPRHKDFSRRSRRNADPRSVVTDGLRAYSAAMSEIGPAAEPHEVGGRLNIPRRIRISRFDDANMRCSAFEVRDVQKFGSVPARVHNQFNQDRHLVTRHLHN